MTQPTIDDFVRETAEYLSRLERLVSLPDAPDADYLLRLARGVRESAERAGAGTTARVAQRLEDAAGSYALRAITWSAELRDLARQTVADLQVLIRALHRWGPEEEARVRAALERWNDLSGETEDGVLHVSELFHDDAGPHVLSTPAGGEWADVVPIESLTVRGDAALREALSLRPRFDALLGDGSRDPALASLVDELFDLLRAASEESGAR